MRINPTTMPVQQSIRAKLTDRQLEILQCVMAFIVVNHRPPSIIEIAKYFGFASPNGAYEHLLALDKKGAIEFIGTGRRSIKIVGVRVFWVLQ